MFIALTSPAAPIRYEPFWATLFIPCPRVDSVPAPPSLAIRESVHKTANPSPCIPTMVVISICSLSLGVLELFRLTGPLELGMIKLGASLYKAS